jgi:hypothetical protein
VPDNVPRELIAASNDEWAAWHDYDWDIFYKDWDGWQSRWDREILGQ